MPSSEQPMAGECDWPKILKCKTLPKVEDMLFLLERDLAAQQAVVVEEIGIGLVDGLGAVDHDLARWRDSRRWQPS